MHAGGDTFTVETPPHRLDIRGGVVGKADDREEIARMVGYDGIPATRLAELMPPIDPPPLADAEEKLRFRGSWRVGLQEVVSYRLTEPSAEAEAHPVWSSDVAPGHNLGVQPAHARHVVLRRSLLSSVLGIAERNSRTAPRQGLFEIGPVFLPREGEPLPEEPLRLAIVMTGRAFPAGWDRHQKAELDFYDLKGVIENYVIRAAYPLHPFHGRGGYHLPPRQVRRGLLRRNPPGDFWRAASAGAGAVRPGFCRGHLRRVRSANPASARPCPV